MFAAKNKDSVEEVGVGDYAAALVKAGVFREDSPLPENDPRVLLEYQKMVSAEFPQDEAPAIKIFAGRYGFFRDCVDNERVGMNWAMSTPIIDMSAGVSFADFVRDLPALMEQADEPLITDVFSFTDGYGDLQQSVIGIIRMNSPVADITMDFPAYLESLTSERRKKFRRMIPDFEQSGLRFEMSERGLDAREVDFVRLHLQKKWGEDWGYAFRQTLYALAVQKVRPQQNLVMRVYKDDLLVFVQTMIVKGTQVYCQSITKNEDEFFSGLAAYTDFKCIEALCGKGPYSVFDPSCRTSLEDPESIGVAKRATVNKNCVKPLLHINAEQVVYDDIVGKDL